MRLQVFFLFAAALLFLAANAAVAPAAPKPVSVAFAEVDRLDGLAPQLERLVSDAPGEVAISVVDLKNGSALSINGNENLPAASTIKVPIMVEVMRGCRSDPSAFTGRCRYATPMGLRLRRSLRGAVG